MYQFQTAYLRENRRQDRWREVDLSDTPVRDIGTDYDEVWLFLTVPGSDNEVAVYFADIRDRTQSVSTSMTLTEWLTDNGNDTLPSRDDPPAFTTRYVAYVNAWHGGYQIQPIGRDGHPDQGGSNDMKADLLIQRDDLDPDYLARYGLFTVNGFVHRIDWSEYGVHILEGQASLRHANRNEIGVHSFTEVGELTYHSLTTEMIRPYRKDASLYDGVLLTLPEDIDLENKTLMLVIGGYLHVQGKVYRRVGDRSYRLDPKRLSFPERYFQSRHYIDLTPLGIDPYDHNDSLVSTNDLLSDSVVEAYLTLPQSFLVVVDTPELFQELVPLEPAGLPDRYLESGDAPQYPILGAYGRMLEYHILYEDGVSVIATDTNQRQRYDFQDRPWRSQKALDGSRYPAQPTESAQAYYRLMGTQD